MRSGAVLTSHGTADEAIDADKTTLILKVHSHALTSEAGPAAGKLARPLPADWRESCCLIGIAPTGAS